MTDAQRDQSTPPRWRVWQVTKANLVALLFVVFVAYPLVGWLVWHNASEDEKREDRRQEHEDARVAAEALERREELCTAIVIANPGALARAVGEPEDSPELLAYRLDLLATLDTTCGEFDLLGQP